MEIVVINENTGQLYLLYLFDDWSANLYYYSTKIKATSKRFAKIMEDNRLQVLGVL